MATIPSGYASLTNGIQPRFALGFAVNGTAIPDPKGFSGKVSDLDILGKRDTTGTLHRKRVATKNPLKIEYENIPWEWIKQICQLMTAEKFNFTYPDPATQANKTIEAYVGDREYEAVQLPENGPWVGNLKFSVIEY